ncbi:MAG: agmatine deiminase family protein [Pirellulaceae bacterium]
MNTSDTSRELSGRWPAEWEPHAATWIAWPHNRDTWPQGFASIPACFARIVRTISEYEPVRVLAGGEAVRQNADAMIGSLSNVTLHDIATNDVWIRDYGPMFLQGPRDDVAAVDWRFNSWGGKYPPWEQDDAVARRVAQRLGLVRFEPNIVLEGGSIDGNGAGTVLTTESCLLDPRRNGNMTHRRMEEVLRHYCGVSTVIWLPGGPLAGDDTDGHVDQLARFVSSSRVVVAVEHNPEDENHWPLHANLKILEAFRDTSGKPLEISQLPMPAPIHSGRQRVPASYCNFYMANRCVLVPRFDDAADDTALKTLESIFVDRDVIGLPARDLVGGLGALHCVTLQQPVSPGQ